GTPALSPPGESVGGGALDVVDHEDFDGAFLRFQAEAELLLDFGEDGGATGFGIGGSGAVRRASSSADAAPEGGEGGGEEGIAPIEGAVMAFVSGLIDHRAGGEHGEHFGHALPGANKGEHLVVERAAAAATASLARRGIFAGFSGHRRQLRTVLSEHEE